MFKKSLCILIGLTSSVAIAQDSYRLAYSKKDDIEIYINNVTAENWCQKDLALQVKGGTDASLEGFETLLPKLGGLFATQCPQASTLSWTYLDSNNTLLAKGASSAAVQWAYQLTERVTPAEEKAVVAETVVALDDIPAMEIEPESEAKLVTAEPPVQVAYLPLSRFSVGDWTPPNEEQRIALSSALSTKKNQDGCQLISHFNFGAQADYVQIQTTGAACEQGYLHGAGQIQLARSDGAMVMRARDVWFYHGLPFTKPVGLMHPQAISLVNGSRYWFGLGSDEQLQSHYFLPTNLRNYSGLGVWDPESMIQVLVADSTSFKQAAAIETQIKEAIARFDTVSAPRNTTVSLRFADATSGVYNRYEQGVVYEINARRRVRHNTAPDPWTYDMASANNHLFQREQARLEQERLAEESRQRQQAHEQQQKERQQARALRQEAEIERRRLVQFNELQQVDLAKGNNLHSYVYRNIQFSLDRTRDYSYMLRGGSEPFSMIVEITGKKDQDAVIEWPYEMRLTQQADLAKGWYWVQGEQKLNSALLDDKGLPVTEVTTESEAIYACKEKKCADLQDPLLLVRYLNGEPDWDPAKAEQLIEQAKTSAQY